MDGLDADIGCNVDIDTQEVLLVASQHNIRRLRELIRENDKLENPVNARDPETGFTPLHAAIAACEPESPDTDQNGANSPHSTQDNDLIEKGIETVKFLLHEGAIWNDLDAKNETPGCLARRLKLNDIYELMVDAGVRAELLLARLEGYEPLQDDDDDDDDETQENPDTAGDHGVEHTQSQTEDQEQPDVVNHRYLISGLSFEGTRLLDSDRNGVMMAWESEIMEKSATALLPKPGLRVLNIGHGMGIVDGFFRDLKPASHHIIEAHPAVVAEMKSKGWHEKPGVTIHEGKWQDILPKLIDEGEIFDAIYYDTFAESYSDFRLFLSEYVIGLLDADGKWGFFNGMGADRQISYDVYQKVVEIDLLEAGFDVDWQEISVPSLDNDKEWEGVRRKYWVIDSYRLPVCRYLE
ncbi:Arginine N-methyltransferase 2 [Myotisia sp. PD_48]|nr:Arginine N-methyltransferase 2 [Myotisia sp. PD_48]